MRAKASELLVYLGKKINTAFDDFTAELTENRAVLAWVYAIAYLVLLYYCVTRNQSTHNTALVVTGGVISTIFTSYVASSAYEKVAQIRSDATAASADDQPDQSGPSE